MNIEFLESTKELNYDDLIFYLSEIVLSKVDEEIELKQNQIDKNKKLFNDMKNEIKELQNIHKNVVDELAKEKQKERVLNLVTALRKEGVVRRNDRLKLIDMLNKIDKYSFDDLRELEKKISLLF